MDDLKKDSETYSDVIIKLFDKPKYLSKEIQHLKIEINEYMKNHWPPLIQ